MSANDPFHHVKDGSVWELPTFVCRLFGLDAYPSLPVVSIFGYEFAITKYMVLQVVALVLSFVIFRGLATRVRDGKPVAGAWWNFWETLALFIRDQVVRPSIGIPHHHDDHDHGHGDGAHDHVEHGHAGAAHVSATLVEAGHPADKYLPYVWSVFFYILFCNLLGAIPFLGSPTGSISVTAVLAVVTFAHVVFFGSQQSGAVGFWKSLVPHMDLPGPLAIVLVPGLWLIEALGLFIKHGVLAVRLFANIMAGHTVLGVFLAFIAQVDGVLWGIVMPASILGQVGIGMLELFVAFLQAYVFSLLTSLFISAAVNPH
ncbi:MAG: F0F1 ATP synthase subunit A [Planctomycetota bacterium]